MKRSIKSPDELSYLQRIFYVDSGMLVEIEWVVVYDV